MVKKIFIFLLALSLGIVFSQFIGNQNQRFQEYNDVDKEEFKRLENPEKQSSSTDNRQSNIINMHRFENAGADSEEEVKSFFTNFQNAISAGDKNIVSSMMQYPLCVRFASDGEEIRTCRKINKESFLKNYDKIFDRDFKNFIADIDVDKRGQLGVLWSNWRGITTDRGQIWIQVKCDDEVCEKQDLKITSVFSSQLERPYNKNLHKDK